MNPLVSVVMPVYNGEEFLNRSIKSFLKQTLKEIELIIVNDGSTDSTKAIIEQYASKDSRIKPINFSDNRGCNIARKTGVMAAAGDYIMFLDADDALFLNGCKQAWVRITEAQADIFHFDTEVVVHKGSYANVEGNVVRKSVENSQVLENLEKLLEPFDGILTGERILRGCFEQKLFSFTIWNKIYRREICQEGYRHVPDIFLNLGEDELGFFFISYYARKYVGDPRQPLYYYTFGSGVSTQQLIALKHIQNLSRCLNIANIIKNFLIEEGKYDYFKTSVDNILDKYQGALFESLYKLSIAGNSSDRRKAFAIALENCDHLALIQYLAPRFKDMPSIVAEGFLDSDLAKPISKPIRTIGTYYSRLRNGGAEKVTSQLIEIWAQMGYRVILFTDEPPHNTDYVINSSYTRVVLPNSNSFDNYVARSDVLANALRDYHVDVMIYHKWVDILLIWDLLVCKEADCAFYIYAHSTIDFIRFADSGSQKYYVQLPLIYKLADCVITLTEMDTAFWNQFAGRVFQTSNPCLLSSEKAQNRTTHGKRILWAGRISEEKRPQDLVRIFEFVLKKIPDAELFVVGSGEPDAIKQIVEYAKAKEFMDHITLTNFQIGVNQFYEQSDIFLLTSAYEGFSMALFEAQSFGLPSIMYELPYLALVQSEKGIVAVEQNAIEDAANAIIDVLQDKENYSRLSKEAYDNAKYFSGVDLLIKWKQILSATADESIPIGSATNKSALQLALSSWIKFNIESSQRIQQHPSARELPDQNSLEPIAQLVQQKMINMSIYEATVHLLKTLARRILGRRLSDRIHLIRIRNQNKS